jgi:hypothetical protein
VSVSLYYSARRDTALSAAERQAVADLIDADDDQYVVADGSEPFSVYPYDTLDDGVVFQGSTKLPPENELVWDAVEHWSRLVSAIRRVIPDAAWSFHIDDRDIAWDGARQEYDMTAENAE